MLPFSQKEPLPAPEIAQIPNINHTTPTDVAPTGGVLSAYRLCYDEEQRLLRHQEKGQPLINIRILGYMFIYNSSVSMLTELASAVLSCSARGDSEQCYNLNNLGQFFLDYWIRPCKCTLSYLHSLVLNFSRSSYHGTNTLLVSSKQTVIRAQSSRDVCLAQVSPERPCNRKTAGDFSLLMPHLCEHLTHVYSRPSSEMGIAA